jgi:16S rRNA processing protein RimM
MPRQEPAEWATIGKIVAPFGIRGELKAFSLSDIPNRFAQLKAVYLTPDYTRSTIEAVRPYKGDMYVLKLKGVNSANAAEALRNRSLCIPLDQIAQLPDDSYYYHDILGVLVMTLSGREVGPIVDIMETGSNDVYVLKGSDGRQILIPAIKDVVKQVDLIRRVMYIDPMGGLLDDDAVLDTPETSTSAETDETEESEGEVL